MSTFNTAITGLKAFQTDIDVIGNNIANANTTGFKASRTEFADLLIQTLEEATAPSGTTGGTNPLQIGAGTQVSAIMDLQTQGSVELTGRSSDLAIQGEGFFVLSDGTRTIYSRAGVFELDANGNLVDTATGMKVQGIKGDISVPLGSSLPPVATTTVEMIGNLNANAVDDPTTTTQDETAVDTTFFVIDSLGGRNQVQVTFTKAGSGASWNYEVNQITTDPVSGSIATPLGSSGVTFSTDGTLAPGTSGGPFAFTPTNGASGVAFSIDFSAMTGFAASSSAAMKRQNGSTAGNLISFAVGRDGTVTGIYSNGQSQALDNTLALAGFTNPSGLLRISNTQFIETPNSGIAMIGAAGGGGRGTIAAGALEQSNVDLATEFVNLIMAQRGYEANARVITVADQIQQTTVNLVR
jgi:flagellar hook protein FlgE